MSETRPDPSVDEILAEIDAKMMQTSSDLDACRLLAAAARALRAQHEALEKIANTARCETDPSACHLESGPYCGAHDMWDDKLIDIAAEALAPSPRTGSSE